MIYSVEITEQADKDLRSIYMYIAFELQDMHSAGKQIDRLEEKIMGLASMPERFRRYAEEPWKSRGLRMMTVDRYCVLYFSDRNLQKVTVLRIMYCGRDKNSQLQKNSQQTD
ncbi:MAG: type II toxin-antitoxin system RelE/ParE family toxin [Erysipelotrichaceae bacterium]|nr:type II toxin-antitoxin system RelE/ParE family toxin [Erysipelotrichaceae bacterium]